MAFGLDERACSTTWLELLQGPMLGLEERVNAERASRPQRDDFILRRSRKPEFVQFVAEGQFKSDWGWWLVVKGELMPWLRPGDRFKFANLEVNSMLDLKCNQELLRTVGNDAITDQTLPCFGITDLQHGWAQCQPERPRPQPDMGSHQGRHPHHRLRLHRHFQHHYSQRCQIQRLQRHSLAMSGKALHWCLQLTMESMQIKRRPSTICLFFCIRLL